MADNIQDYDTFTSGIIACAIEVHRVMGPGLLESAYEQCLCHELSLRKITFQCQVEIPVSYKGVLLNCGYRLDIYFPGRLIVELKAVEKIDPVHEAQLLTYMKLTKVPVGLLINFNTKLLKDGIRRFSL